MNDEIRRGQAAVQRSFEPRIPDHTVNEEEGDDRRGRYYRAAVDAMDWRYADLGPVVDAAMAVADEEWRDLNQWAVKELTTLRAENARLRAELAGADSVRPDLHTEIEELDKAANALDRENARLRAELTSTKAAHRAVWDKHQARGQKIFDLQGELASLRDELEAARTEARGQQYRADELLKQGLALESTIERVRAVLDSLAGGPETEDVETAIRAALEGDQ